MCNILSDEVAHLINAVSICLTSNVGDCFILKPCCFYYISLSKLFLNAVNRLVHLNFFLGIVEKIDLVVAGNEIRKADTDQADEETSGVDFQEKFLYRLQDYVVLVGIGNTFLRGEGVKI